MNLYFNIAIYKIVWFLHRTLIVIIFLLSYSYHIFSQEPDCFYAAEYPIIFQQDSVRTILARQIIQQHQDSTDQLNAPTKIGVSREEVLEDLMYMIDHPNQTLLNDSGYYCGIVVILNWMLNNIPDNYVQAVIDLTFTGKTKFKNGSKWVKLPKHLTKNVNYTILASEEGVCRSDIGTISISDFVLGVSLVYSEKAIQRMGLLWKKATHHKKNIGNFIFANTMPWVIDDYFRIIGINNVTRSYYSPFERKDTTLSKISSAVDSGVMPILMENHLLTSDQHKNSFYKIFGAHFITVHDFTYNSECNTISLSYWDYGSVKNHRDQSLKGSPLAARSLNAAIRKASRKNKIIKDDKYIELTIDQFFKGLKGYWIPENE